MNATTVAVDLTKNVFQSALTDVSEKLVESHSLSRARFMSFVLWREFVNGVDGVVVSYMYAFQRFIRLAKTRERFRLARKRQKPGK